MGLQRLLALARPPVPLPKVQLVVVKRPAWPTTRPATVTVVKGVLYSSTRLLPVPATKKAPAASTATPRAPHRLLALMPPRLQSVDAKLPPWPNTRSATVSAVKGVLYSSTRLLKSLT